MWNEGKKIMESIIIELKLLFSGNNDRNDVVILWIMVIICQLEDRHYRTDFNQVNET